MRLTSFQLQSQLFSFFMKCGYKIWWYMYLSVFHMVNGCGFSYYHLYHWRWIYFHCV